MAPSDPFILLSYVNTKLRDGYADLADLCAAEDLSPELLAEQLAAIGYRYDPGRNQFV